MRMLPKNKTNLSTLAQLLYIELPGSCIMQQLCERQDMES